MFHLRCSTVKLYTTRSAL